MTDKVEELRRHINDMDYLIWKIRAHAVQHKDEELLESANCIRKELGILFNEVGELDGDK